MDEGSALVDESLDHDRLGRNLNENSLFKRHRG